MAETVNILIPLPGAAVCRSIRLHSPSGGLHFDKDRLAHIASKRFLSPGILFF
jgi:hypothetical protein